MTSPQTQATPAQAPLTNLLTQPRRFYPHLRALPARGGRYFWLVLLSGLVGAAASVLLAGSLARAAEVYGATFLVTLVTLIWFLILLPLAALFPPQIVGVPPLPTGLEGPALADAVRERSAALSAAYNANWLARLSTWGSYAVYALQFALAYLGLPAITGERGRALRGVLAPLLIGAVIAVGFTLLGRRA